MSSFKATFDLVQITPLLHFQPETEGAFLRPSEVKPKLDKFLKAYLQRARVNVASDLPHSWTGQEWDGAGDKKPAERVSFRYKMRFFAEGEPVIYQNYQDRELQRQNSNPIHGLYFAAMGNDAFLPDGTSKTKGVLYGETCTLKLEVLGLSTETMTLGGREVTLLKLLKQLIPPFFALHCFGARSNKGFGSFMVKDYTPAPKDLVSYIDAPALYYLRYPGSTQNPASCYFDDIQNVSAILKGGINFSTMLNNSDATYLGMIFDYFLDQDPDLHSEKGMIKRDILSMDRTEPQEDARFAYMRGVLGLAGEFEYKRDNRNRVNSGTIKVEDPDMEEKKRNGKDYIARAENPIHYKPYGSYILLIPQPIPQKLLGFEVKMYKPQDRAIRIRIPDTFDLDDFMQYAADLFEHDTYLRDFEDPNSVFEYRGNLKTPVRKMQATLRRFSTIYRAGKEAE